MTQLISSQQNAIKKNRKYLKVIIETLIFCAQQNIPLRGFNEDRSNIGSHSDTNRGNFLEVLHLRSRGIPWLSFKLNQQRQIHAQWLSPEIQNELLLPRISSDKQLLKMSKQQSFTASLWMKLLM